MDFLASKFFCFLEALGSNLLILRVEAALFWVHRDFLVKPQFRCVLAAVKVALPTSRYCLWTSLMLSSFCLARENADTVNEVSCNKAVLYVACDFPHLLVSVLAV